MLAGYRVSARRQAIVPENVSLGSNFGRWIQRRRHMPADGLALVLIPNTHGSPATAEAAARRCMTGTHASRSRFDRTGRDTGMGTGEERPGEPGSWHGGALALPVRVSERECEPSKPSRAGRGLEVEPGELIGRQGGKPGRRGRLPGAQVDTWACQQRRWEEKP